MVDSCCQLAARPHKKLLSQKKVVQKVSLDAERRRLPHYVMRRDHMTDAGSEAATQPPASIDESSFSSDLARVALRNESQTVTNHASEVDRAAQILVELTKAEVTLGQPTGGHCQEHAIANGIAQLYDRLGGFLKPLD